MQETSGSKIRPSYFSWWAIISLPILVIFLFRWASFWFTQGEYSSQEFWKWGGVVLLYVLLTFPVLGMLGRLRQAAGAPLQGRAGLGIMKLYLLGVALSFFTFRQLFIFATRTDPKFGLYLGLFVIFLPLQIWVIRYLSRVIEAPRPLFASAPANMPQEKVQALKTLVGENQLREVFEELTPWIQDHVPKEVNKVITLQNQWNQIIEQEMLGVLNLEQINQQKAKLSLGLLTFLDQMEDSAP